MIRGDISVSNPNKLLKLGILVFLICLIILPDRAQAIPSFSRKYKTSCATCHVGFPKLTPFGEAYRLNGFQMPEVEEESIKEEPVSLGSEGYKRVWPKAIWPGSIPGTSPVSFRIRSGFKYMSQEDTQYAEFTQPALQIMTGGTFGENISFYVGAHLFEDGEVGSLDRLYLKFDNMFSKILPYNALYLRVGQFVPDIVPFITNHRGLTLAAFAFNTYAPSMGSGFLQEHAHGAGPFGIEAFQLGAEASGILKSRLRYVLGVVNGNGVEEDNNSAKDVYFRLGYKLGGMAYDGSSEGNIYGPRGNNWSEKSLAISAFGYSGTGVSSSRDVNFSRLGVDFNLFMRDLNLFGGVITGTDASYVGENLQEEKYTLFFVEGNHMIYPWLIGVLRFEQANPDDFDSFRQITVHITALYTANIKFIVENRFDPDNAEFNNLSLGMDFVF